MAPPPPPFLPPPLGMSNPVGWLVETIPLHLEWCNRFIPGNGMTREQVLTLWVRWGLRWDLLQIFRREEGSLQYVNVGDKEQSTVPYGYLFARPARLSTITDPATSYFDSLFTFEGDGDCIWIDTIWAPGCYSQVINWLKSKQTAHRTMVAWEHKGRFFMKRIDELSGSRPRKSEIKDAFVRAV